MIAIIETDKGEEMLQMQLVEGSKEEGRWMGSWITKDISLRDSYKTIFRATNTKGQYTEIPLLWYIEKD